MKIKSGLLPCILSFVCMILGGFVAVTLTAYQFSGLVLAGIGVLILCYTGLKWLGNDHPTAAKLLRLVLTTVLILGLLAAFFTGTLIAWESEGHATVNCRYIVVLGAGVDGTRPSLSLSERIQAAYVYLEAYPQSICVVSGGQGGGEDISEAECMYNELVRRGIDPERIWQEDQAANTGENIQFSLDLIEERTGTRPTQIGLVSSEYHLFRAGMIAARQDVAAVGIPATTTIVPLRINYFLREIPAVWYYALFRG